MQVLTRDEAIGWCGRQGIRVTGRDLAPSWGVNAAIRVMIDPVSPRAMALGDQLLGSCSHGDAVKLWPGGLVWHTDNHIWSPQTNRVGHALMGALARSAVGERVVGQPTAVAVGKDELIEAKCALYLALLFQWDAWLVLEGAETFFEISHDLFVIASSSSVEVIEDLRTSLAEGGWSVRER